MLEALHAYWAFMSLGDSDSETFREAWNKKEAFVLMEAAANLCLGNELAVSYPVRSEMFLSEWQTLGSEELEVWALQSLSYMYTSSSSRCVPQAVHINGNPNDNCVGKGGCIKIQQGVSKVDFNVSFQNTLW